MLRHRTGIHEQLKRQKNALNIYQYPFLYNCQVIYGPYGRMINSSWDITWFAQCFLGCFAHWDPGTLDKFLFILQKKIGFQFRETSAPSDFYPTKFWWALTIFKGAIILPRGRIKFCQAWNLIDFSIYKPQFEGSNQSGKFYLAF